ncbi:peroxide stress protein YaaA [Amedibacillus sp. YH-ame10]
MIILISPAKIMKEQRIHEPSQLPIYLSKTKSIVEQLKTHDIEGLKKLMKIDDKIATMTLQRFSDMKFDHKGFSALDIYDGIAFKAIAIETCKDKQWNYLDKHLRILSGLYGIVKPSDSIYPYRLEMQTKLSVDDTAHLYAYWMEDLASAIIKEQADHIEPYILNLASKEYDKCIRPYIKDDSFIDIEFYERKDHKIKMHSTQVKKARGMMVRFLADYHIEYLEDVKTFQEDGYKYHDALSSNRKLVFVKDM